MTTPTAEAPAGIVTFVFTDIEGSTRLFHRLGDRYVGLLERHNLIVRDALAAHDGYEVSTDGDAFFAAFGDATAAVAACADVQRKLNEEPWPEGVSVRVRMGVHTGLASPRGGDYVALAVHQASRVVAAAHGGLVLVSQDTVDVLEPGNGLSVEPLGRYRLHDFDEPLALYRLVGAGIGDTFPALRAVPADGHNIVQPPTPTIGRDELIKEIAGQVEAGRVVTLVGPGGVGKTRVVMAVGMHIAPSWADGVWLVDLSGVGEAALVIPAVADAIGAPAKPDRDRWDDVLEYLSARSAVVILDNAEHLRDTCQALVQALQANCPEVGIIAASRLPLRIPGEILRPVEPLEVPEDSPQGVAAVLDSPAGRLFAERAAAVRPGFQVESENAAAIADICRHLDGLPLSIELAAAHLAVQSPQEIRSGLGERFQLLRSLDRETSDRHRSVEEMLGWSYSALSDDERAAFRCLSAFGDGFSIETAQHAIVASGIRPIDVPMLVWSLVDRSLVVADLTANETRYRLLETMRSYGSYLLDDAGETEAVTVALANALVDKVGPWWEADRRWLGDVGMEVDNLRALISLMPAAREELAQQIACTIGRYHDAKHTFRDGIDEVGRCVESLPALTPTRVSLLSTLADLHLRTGGIDAAEGVVADAAALRDELGAPAWDDIGVDRTIGEIARRSGNLEEAVIIAQETLQRPLSDRGRSRMLNLLGTTSAALGDMETAYEALAEELELSKAVGKEGNIASAHGNLAEVAMRIGDTQSAALHQAACLDLGVSQGSSTMVAFSLIVAARLAGERGEWATAIRLHAHGEVLLEETGLALYEDDRQQSDELLAAGRAALGDGQFATLVAEGERLQVTDAVDLARATLGEAQSVSGA